MVEGVVVAGVDVEVEADEDPVDVELEEVDVEVEPPEVELEVVVTAGARTAKIVKWETEADTSLLVVSTDDASPCQTVPFQYAIYRLDSLTPAGTELASYFNVRMAAGAKTAPLGLKL